VRETWFSVLLFIGSGCHASVQAHANADTHGQSDAELDAEVQKERAMAAPTASTPPAVSAAPSGHALLGARTDLSLEPADVQGQCSCVRVALGPATLGAFRWKGAPPTLDEQTQLAIALTSTGSGCENPKGTLGASYWGYRRIGDDIVVYVENAVSGRPIAQGAIIPKPFGQGQVYLAPTAKKVPFGKPLNGKGNCKLGNPGVARTVPVGADEVGAPAAAPTPADDFLSGQ
jgi:hypothetical protein